MAVYAIGDIQGCFRTLQRLLARIRFDPARDRLWLVGDLVNRGPRSLQVLRWARGLGDRATIVLGNHDLHLIGSALGVRRAKRRDTLEPVLDAPDCDELVDWLLQRPLLHREGAYVLVHAGLLPSWSLSQAETLAREAETALRQAPKKTIEALRTRTPVHWRQGLSPRARVRIALDSFTTLRTCSRSGRPCADFSGAPEAAPRGCRPWFEIPGRRSAAATVVCGHWAALGLRIQTGLLALDTGCVWGRVLTAVRLEDRAVFQEPLADVV
jgi:bis(5'-nucleosyl)-tetraphosphatase (symmetrical)